MDSRFRGNPSHERCPGHLPPGGVRAQLLSRPGNRLLELQIRAPLTYLLLHVLRETLRIRGFDLDRNPHLRPIQRLQVRQHMLRHLVHARSDRLRIDRHRPEIPLWKLDRWWWRWSRSRANSAGAPRPLTPSFVTAAGKRRSYRRQFDLPFRHRWMHDQRVLPPVSCCQQRPRQMPHPRPILCSTSLLVVSSPVFDRKEGLARSTRFNPRSYRIFASTTGLSTGRDRDNPHTQFCKSPNGYASISSRYVGKLSICRRSTSGDNMVTIFSSSTARFPASSAARSVEPVDPST